VPASDINLVPDYFSIGGEYTGVNLTTSYTGYISEVIIFDRYLKTNERQSVERYLSQKYNIAVAH